MLTDKSRLLAIDPTSKGFAFALLEGSERLVEWGLSHVPNLEEVEYLNRIEVLLKRFSPRGLALEDPRGPGSRRGDRVVKLLRSIELLAWRYKVEIVRVSRRDVQDALGGSGRTKHALALTVARWFTELEPLVPDVRRAWDSEAERMNIFDAVSFAMTAFHLIRKRNS
ncbi:MAG TPA: hypothetical protein VOA87_13590 [Thermoanaerobaculia bacterium]|nr:hypothetical protein [Thermoanaerobaculia bacterium]